MAWVAHRLIGQNGGSSSNLGQKNSRRCWQFCVMTCASAMARTGLSPLYRCQYSLGQKMECFELVKHSIIPSTAGCTGHFGVCLALAQLFSAMAVLNADDAWRGQQAGEGDCAVRGTQAEDNGPNRANMDGQGVALRKAVRNLAMGKTTFSDHSKRDHPPEGVANVFAFTRRCCNFLRRPRGLRAPAHVQSLIRVNCCSPPWPSPRVPPLLSKSICALAAGPTPQPQSDCPKAGEAQGRIEGCWLVEVFANLQRIFVNFTGKRRQRVVESFCKANSE